MEGERQGEAWLALELRGGTAKFGCGVLLQGVCEPSSSLLVLGYLLSVHFRFPVELLAAGTVCVPGPWSAWGGGCLAACMCTPDGAQVQVSPYHPLMWKWSSVGACFVPVTKNFRENDIGRIFCWLVLGGAVLPARPSRSAGDCPSAEFGSDRILRPLPSGSTSLHCIFPISKLGGQDGSRMAFLEGTDEGTCPKRHSPDLRPGAGCPLPVTSTPCAATMENEPLVVNRTSAVLTESEARRERIYHTVLRSHGFQWCLRGSPV